MKLKKLHIFGIILLLVVIIVGVLLWTEFFAYRAPELPKAIEIEPVIEEDIPLASSVATGLQIPWSLTFLSNGDMLLTERLGRVRLIDKEEGLLPEPLLVFDDVEHIGEGGLLGVELHPQFESNNYVYFYFTYATGEILKNKVVRYKFVDGEFFDREQIIEEIPGGQFHNGGRIKFGPDGMLYITTGDAVFADSAQFLGEDELSGKILRMTPDGDVPNDNPFENSYVYSYGHRNPQGLAWDPVGQLWSTEHGQKATDEVNFIEPGNNYGWPIIRGDQKQKGMISPFVQSGDITWAPGGIAYLNGSIFFVGLRGQTLYEFRLEDSAPIIHEHFAKEFGRLRDVVVGPDEMLYVLTSNRDGRGVPFAQDDQIIRINPEKL